VGGNFFPVPLILSIYGPVKMQSPFCPARRTNFLR